MAGESNAQYQEIPGEPGLYRCPRHTRETTRLRCGRCERPICSKCTVFGPSGARCRECASNRGLHIYRVSPSQFALTFLVSFLLSALASVLVSAIGWFILLYAALAGNAVSRVADRITRGKRGVPPALVASSGALLGALLPSVVTALILHGGRTLFFASLLNPILWIYLILVIPALWYWIR